MKRLYTDENIDELNEAIEIYFDGCTEQGIMPGFAGLAYALGFCQRHTLNEYAKRDDNTSVPIKRATLRIEAAYESQLNKQSCTGAIFALKNRGWTDKQSVDLNIKDKADLSKLSREEIAKLAELNRKLRT